MVGLPRFVGSRSEVSIRLRKVYPTKEVGNLWWSEAGRNGSQFAQKVYPKFTLS